MQRPFMRGMYGMAFIALTLAGCGSSEESSSLPSTAPSSSKHVPRDYREGESTDPAVVAACDRYARAETDYESRCTIAMHPDKYAYYTDRFRLACRVAASEPG